MERSLEAQLCVLCVSWLYGACWYRSFIVWIYLWKIQGDLFSGCVHITDII